MTVATFMFGFTIKIAMSLIVIFVGLDRIEKLDVSVVGYTGYAIGFWVLSELFPIFFVSAVHHKNFGEADR
jgi:hypothetical protein